MFQPASKPAPTARLRAHIKNMNKENTNGNLNLIQFPGLAEIEKFISHSYGNKVSATHMHILRHRDFSGVARVFIADRSRSLVRAPSIIYKRVIAPWHNEAKIASYVSESALPNTPRYIRISQAPLSAQILQDDLGETSLKARNSRKLAYETGQRLAEIHARAKQTEFLLPGDLEQFDAGEKIFQAFDSCAHQLLKFFPDFDKDLLNALVTAGRNIAAILEGSEMCLQHGDVYAENIVLKGDALTPTFIDWSYFCFLGPQLYDLSTLTSAHEKNRALYKHRNAVISGYCDAAELSIMEAMDILPYAFRFSRLAFLSWLTLRVGMGITQTTVGPVRPLIEKVIREIVS